MTVTNEREVLTPGRDATHPTVPVGSPKVLEYLKVHGMASLGYRHVSIMR